MQDVLRGETYWDGMGTERLVLVTTLVLGAADPHDQGAGHVVAEGSASLANQLGGVHDGCLIIFRENEAQEEPGYDFERTQQEQFKSTRQTAQARRAATTTLTLFSGGGAL